MNDKDLLDKLSNYTLSSNNSSKNSSSLNFSKQDLEKLNNITDGKVFLFILI